MDESRGLVPIGDLAVSLTLNHPLVSVDVTPHEAQVWLRIGARQR